MSSQCEHVFKLEEDSSEVRCVKCGDLDDEMQLPLLDPEVQDAFDNVNRAIASQINFE